MDTAYYTGLHIFAPLIFMSLWLTFNLIFGFIASRMASKRGLRKVPAFWLGFFGSFLSLFIIAMFPKKL